MKRRVPYAAAGLSTQVKSCTLIGGEGKFCAERFGWTETAEGLSSSYTLQPVQPAIVMQFPILNQYLPAYGYSLLITRFGQVFRWNTTEHNTLKPWTVLSPLYPIIVPCVIDGESVYGLIDGTKVAVVRKDSITASQLPTMMNRGTIHCGRVFGIEYYDRYNVHWSGLTVTDWTQSMNGSGHIKLTPAGGAALNLVEYGDKLVVVRETGLNIITALGDPKNFRITQSELYVLPPVIIDTSVICGGQLWICTTDGLYKFNGSTPQKVELDLCGDEFVFTRATAFRGRYLHLEGTCNGVPRIIEYDTVTGSCTQFAEGCSLLFDTADALYCLNGTTLTELVKGEDDPSRIWRSKAIDLGTAMPKTLKSITFEGEGDVTVTANCDGRVLGVYGTGVSNIHGRGVSFTFDVKGTGKVTKLAAEWEVSK